MNKKLLAMAVGAAIAFPGAALADGPKVYGKVNVSLEQYEPELSEYDDTLAVDALKEASQDRWQLDSNASRLGVKGDFDLDVANLTAIYKLEYEIAVDDGNAVFKQRNIFGGFKGGFGTIMAGNFDTPLKTSQGKIDQFNDIDGDIKTILRGETRASNIIQYSTPKLADMVTLNIAIMPAENDDLNGGLDNKAKNDNGLADKTSISAVFEQGGLYAALAMDKNNDDKTLIIDDTAGAPVDILRLVLAYKTDAFELGLLHQTAEETDDDKSGFPTIVKAGEETSTVLSGAFKMDRWKFKAQYGMTESSQLLKEDALNNNPRELSDDPSLTLTAFGVDYKMAKASKVYAYYAEVEADTGLTQDGINAINPLTAKKTLSDTTLGFGFEHKF
ncbi:MAG: porin [Alcanivoracaceae bacterium]|nr:porin [Alcanivoracaceae bacterium]